MAETPKLDSHHQATVQKILSHPTSHNIEWHDVISLLGQVGSVIEESDGVYKVTIGARQRRSVPRGLAILTTSR